MSEEESFEDVPEEYTGESDVTVEETLKRIMDQVLGEPTVLLGWVIVAEVADQNMDRMLLPISRVGQPKWVTKSMHQEAIDSIRNEEVIQELLEGSDSYRGDEDGSE